MKRYYFFIGILTVLVLLMIVGGVQLIGTPLENREKVADREKVDQVIALTQKIETYYQDNKKLPVSLDNIAVKESYKYKVVSATEYEMCVTFSTDNSKDSSKGYLKENSGQRELYSHSAGENCIKFTLPEYLMSIGNRVVFEPIAGQFSSMSATLNQADSQFNFEYSGKSSIYTVEMSTFPDFSENIYLTFATGLKSPLMAKKDVEDYADYYCGQTVFWRIKADLGVVSEVNESVVCGSEAVVTPLL